jgi:hypothetical protein
VFHIFQRLSDNIQKNSHILQKISHVFGKNSDVFPFISDVFPRYSNNLSVSLAGLVDTPQARKLFFQQCTMNHRLLLMNRRKEKPITIASRKSETRFLG